MNARWLTLSAALAAAVAAWMYHGSVVRRQSALATERARVEAEATTLRAQAEEAARQLAAAREKFEQLVAERAGRAAGTAVTVSASPSASGAPKAAASPPDPALRPIRVQAFVSEQGLRFAALLKRVGFSGEQRERFDRINGDYQQAMLEDAQTDGGRQQARRARDEQLQELFGPAFEQWTDANRNQPARAVVEEIVQRMFQGSGALTGGQADELTRMVGQHRVPPTNPPKPGPSSYDWDAIVTEAHAILADRQLESFVAAVEFRRASEKMSALAATRSK